MFTLRIKNTAAWARFWVGVGNVGQLGPREARLVAAAARRGLALNFEREQTWSGTPWHPLAKRTQRERRKRGFAGAHPILVQRGRLKKAFTQLGAPQNVTRTASSAAGVVWQLGGDTPPDYERSAAELHFGTPKMPARPFVGLGGQAQEWVGNQAAAVVWQRLTRSVTD